MSKILLSRKIMYPGHLGSLTLDLRLPTLRMQAQERCSRPRILFGMGDEGGGPIYVQALGLRSGRHPRACHLDNL
ncbi:hypothetical protein, partial [Thiolapillus sp.]|uniref:hypothetical protein n=1 Tax=Thiolapillus sp. TaxID=2017437 RepID=UPI003AF8424B